MDKQKVPFKVVIDLSLDGIQGMPEGSNANDMFWNVCLGAIKAYSDKHTGLDMQEHKKLKVLRLAFEKVIGTQPQEGASVVEVEYEAFKWLIKCWTEQRQQFSVNELLSRCGEIIQRAKEQHDEQTKDL